jgi:hypothetical protein
LGQDFPKKAASKKAAFLAKSWDKVLEKSLGKNLGQ